MAERTRFVAQRGDDQRDLPQPGGRRGDRLRRRLDAHRRISDTVHNLPPCWEQFCSSSSRRHIFTRVRYWLHLVAQFVGFVRHPLYLGCLLMTLGAPLLLGSLYGFIIGFIGVIAVVGRIIGEENMLANELEGYEDYKKKVKYRLVPFVW
jgi:hypothetical protein